MGLIKDQLRSADIVLVDLDGCLIASGKPLPGAQKLIHAADDKLVLLSNSSRNTAPELSAQLAAIGLQIPASNILLAGEMTIHHAAREYAGQRIMLMGSDSLKALALSLDCQLVEDEPDVVILTRDPYLSYESLAVAMRAAASGVRFLVSNPDLTHPDINGQPVPETGMLLEMFKTAVPSLNYMVFGKPEAYMFVHALQKFNARAGNTLMIGDNPNTDGEGARRLGITPLIIGASAVSMAANLNVLLEKPAIPMNKADDNGTPVFRTQVYVPEVLQVLNKSASWLLDVIETMAEAFVYWDANDRMVLCNSKYPQRFREPHKVVPGVHFADLVEHNLQTRRVEIFEDVRNVALTPETYRKKRMDAHRACRGSFEMLNFNGRWEQGRERRTRDGGTVAIYTDITAIKEAEQREQQARQAAEKANEAKSRFLAAASHDLRQPLHAIGILASVLHNQLQTDASRETLASIESCLQTMNNLFDSLLDVSRLDAGVIKPEPRPMLLSDLLASVYREFSPFAQSKGLKFNVRISQCMTVSDPGMLGRILRNLVSNALKYTPGGGVTVGVRKSGTGLRIEVYDTGIGFHACQLSDMFAEFKQLDVGSFKQQGLGLGLSIASRLSDMLGHSLTAISTPGKGSRFTIHVPLYQAAAGRLNRDIDVFEGINFSHKCVWVVDDDQDILDAMYKLLGSWGCEVITAASQEQVQGCASQHAPDLLLVDFHLTESVNGLDIINQVTRITGTSFPAVVITGDTSPVYLKEIEHLGYSVLHKPLHPMKIRAVMQQYLNIVQD